MEEPISLDESAWKRGWRDTKHGWGDWRFILLEAIVAPLIGFSVGLITDSTSLGFIVGIGIVLVGLISIWIGATVRAPYRQRDEARALAGSRSPTAIYDQLGEYLATIQEILERDIRDQQGVDRFRLDFARVAAETEAFIESNISKAEAARFRNLSGTMSMQWDRKFNAEHNGLLTNLNRIRENLENLMDRVEQRS